MRALTDHIVEGTDSANQLTIEVQDQPGQGGACHLYHITGFNSGTNPSDPWTARHGQPAIHSTVLFQSGPIKEFGINGVTQEALLAIVIDRLRSFQAGPFACDENAVALKFCENALQVLQTRTRLRMARGVEGTNQK